LILAFVVFNPGDLYYLGYKKIIIMITNEDADLQPPVIFVFSFYYLTPGI